MKSQPNKSAERLSGSEHFKKTIQTYLEKRAGSDTLFAVSFRKPAKNLDDCITYILNEVRKLNVNGLTDDEVYSLAVHYYDEDDIEVGNPVGCQVVVNHTVELTEEEKEQAKRDAIQRAQEEAYRQMKQPKRKKSVKPAQSNVEQKLFLNDETEDENSTTCSGSPQKITAAYSCTDSMGLRALYRTYRTLYPERHYHLYGVRTQMAPNA